MSGKDIADERRARISWAPYKVPMCSERAGGVTGRSTDRREGARAQGKGEGNFMIKNGRFGFGEILCRRENGP